MAAPIVSSTVESNSENDGERQLENHQNDYSKVPDPLNFQAIVVSARYGSKDRRTVVMLIPSRERLDLIRGSKSCTVELMVSYTIRE